MLNEILKLLSAITLAILINFKHKKYPLTVSSLKNQISKHLSFSLYLSAANTLTLSLFILSFSNI